MSDPQPADHLRAHDAAPDADRDAKIEQLLLAGLDHYFSGQHEQAINVWTRALFLDRSHPRARAYIERARSALAERQRESEEMLHRGVAAFERGDGEEARRLIETAIGRGAPSDEALAVLDRLDRLEQGLAPEPQSTHSPASRAGIQVAVAPRAAGIGFRIVTWMAVAVLLVAIGGMAVVSSHSDWRSLLVLQRQPVPVAPMPESALPVPTRGADLLDAARHLQASGHLHEALASLDKIRLTDPEKAESDELRGAIQKQLIDLAAPPQSKDDARKP